MTRSAARALVVATLLVASVSAVVALLPGRRNLVRDDGAQSSRLHPITPPFLIFRTLAPPEVHGHVAILPLPPASAPQRVSSLQCARLHYAGGRGVCLVQELFGTVTRHAGYIFDRHLRRGLRIGLAGVPTRVRVAPDGRRAAITTYAEEETPEGERLATDTVIVDLGSARVVADLRHFAIHDSRHMPLAGPVDVGSVSFTRDGNRFFAALTTPTERYIAAGSITEERMTTIRAGLVSEALSPDETRLAVKKLGPHGFWQLAVLDLQTGTARDLAQGSRSVDDQVEWLDPQHVLYHDVNEGQTSLWALPIDGVTGPSLLVPNAYCGTVQSGLAPSAVRRDKLDVVPPAVPLKRQPLQ
jgi:hypothetical protein